LGWMFVGSYRGAGMGRWGVRMRMRIRGNRRAYVETKLWSSYSTVLSSYLYLLRGEERGKV